MVGLNFEVKGISFQFSCHILLGMVEPNLRQIFSYYEWGDKKVNFLNLKRERR